MGGNVLQLVILVLAALAAMMAGLAAFGQNKPPDARINQVMGEMDEMKSMILQMQKSVMQLERRGDKESKELRAELKEVLERMADRIDKRLAEIAG
jgi:uncharacterized protein HemX